MLQKLSNLKIGKRLWIGFGAGLAATIIVVSIGIYGLSSLNDNLGKIVHDRFPKTVQANNIIDQANLIARVMGKLPIILDEPQKLDAEIARLEPAYKIIDENIATLKETITSEEGKKILDNASRFDDEFMQVNNEFVNLVKNNDTSLENYLFTKWRDKEHAFIGAVNALIDFQGKKMEEEATLADETYSSAKLAIILITIAIIMLLVAASILITKSIREPVEDLNEAALKVAGGALGINVPVKSTDEIGELSKSFNAMSDKITQMMTDLDGLPAPLMMIDNEFNVTYFNKAAAASTGNQQSDCIGKKCYDLFKTEHCRTENCATHKAMMSRTAQLSETIARPKGTPIPIAYAAKPNIDKNGKVIGALEFVTDLTKAKEYEKYLDKNAEKLLAEMDKFAQGDLTIKLTAEKNDDVIGQLFNGFNKLVQNIKNMILSLTDAIQATASASAQISSSAEEMAAGAQEQSTQTTEIAGAVEQMTKTIMETSKNSASAAEQSKVARDVAKDGGKSISDTIEGMNKIANVVEDAASTIKELGKSSEKIGTIIEVIDDIADQTNLLALNAAIEAARAGEHGRGFAVVADEVRKLAERTTKATKEIGSMIKEIQKDTYGAVTAMESGTEEVQHGTKLAHESGSSLNEIISNTDQVLDIINQVAAASEEQSSAAEQISHSIEGINSVTQQAAAGVQQIARAAEDLNNLTVTLQRLVDQFKIDDNHLSSISVRHNGSLIQH